MSGYNNGGETDWLPASEAENYNPARYDHLWNEDFSKFKAVKLLWWDDASYIAYQCGDHVAEAEHREEEERLAAEDRALRAQIGDLAANVRHPWDKNKPATIANLPAMFFDDDIPF